MTKKAEKETDVITKELTLGERFAASALFPEKGDYITKLAIKRANEALMPDEKEIKEYKIAPVEGGGLKWPPEMANITAPIELSARAITLLEDALRDLNTKEQLEDSHMSLFEKIVGVPT